jgi:hypothetical protein
MFGEIQQLTPVDPLVDELRPPLVSLGMRLAGPAREQQSRDRRRMINRGHKDRRARRISYEIMVT